MELDGVLTSLKNRPETYETILKEGFDNRNTATNWVRNQFSNWCYKWDLIGYGVLDGTRFGKKIFYSKEKEYLIVITRIKNTFQYFYCDMVEEKDDMLILTKCYRLDKYNWEEMGDYGIQRNDLIRWY